MGGYFPDERIPARYIFASHVWFLERLDAYRAQKEVCGQGVMVALLDTGVETTHPALAGRLRLDLARNFGDPDRPYDVEDPVGHGTAMAGLILQVAPCAEVIPIKISAGISASFTVESLLSALDYVRDLAGRYPSLRVVNLSLVMAEEDEEVAQRLAELAEKGLYLPAAAGNEGSEEVAFPARLFHTLAVSSTNQFDEPLVGANYGPPLVLVAPGEVIWAPWRGGSYVYLRGTSTSTALVSGALALLCERSPSGALWALLKTARDLGPPGHDPETGFGMPSLAEALNRAEAEGFYSWPEKLVLLPGEVREVRFFPLEFSPEGIPPFLEAVASGSGYVAVRALRPGRGYLSFSRADRCVKVPVEVPAPEEAPPFEAHLFFFSHRASVARNVLLYLLYDLEVFFPSSPRVEFWATCWQGDGFHRQPLFNPSTVSLGVGFYRGVILQFFSGALSPGIYEVGATLSEGEISLSTRAFLWLQP